MSEKNGFERLALVASDAARAQEQWLASHRGRIFVESSTTEVLRFVNVAIPAGAGAR